MGPGSHRPSELERLRLIAGIASRMHEGQDLDAILQGTADAIHDVLGFPGCSFTSNARVPFQ